MVPVNPHEGQVAIPYAHGDATHVVGCLGNRAMRWVEEAIGRTIDDVYFDAMRRAALAEAGQPVAPTLSVTDSATVIWAAIEHHRRRSKAPGPEFTIDDADEIVEQVGIDDASGYATTLIQLSRGYAARLKRLEEAAAAEGQPSPADPLRAAAAGTGIGSSLPPPVPASPSTSSGI